MNHKVMKIIKIKLLVNNVAYFTDYIANALKQLSVNNVSCFTTYIANAIIMLFLTVTRQSTYSQQFLLTKKLLDSRYIKNYGTLIFNYTHFVYLFLYIYNLVYIYIYIYIYI